VPRDPEPGAPLRRPPARQLDPQHVRALTLPFEATERLASRGPWVARHPDLGARRHAQPFDVTRPGRVRGEQVGDLPSLEARAREAGCHRASEERPAPTGDELASLPDAGGDDDLDALPAGNIRAHDHLVVRPVRAKQDEPERVAAVEVPDLVELEPVEERATQRILAVEPDSGRAYRPARRQLLGGAVRVHEEGRLDGKPRHAEALDQEFRGGVDPAEAICSVISMSAPAPAVERLLDLGGKVAIVTGASGSIGAGIARRLHEAGASVVAHARQDRGLVEPLAGELGTRVAVATGDVERDAHAICAAAVESFGGLDVVVNNAGIQPVARLSTIANAEVAELLRVNVVGVAAMTREAAALMAGGAIVNVGSIEGLQPAFDHSHYAASKAAVIMHTRAAALELGPARIRVNCVSPGLIDSQGLDEVWPEGVSRWCAAAPLGRLGAPVDVADAVLFLASPAARFITGANLVVDGGVLAHNTW
jgi:3-oxoacyl-[acyl-carrier protein] reductase